MRHSGAARLLSLAVDNSFKDLFVLPSRVGQALGN